MTSMWIVSNVLLASRYIISCLLVNVKEREALLTTCAEIVDEEAPYGEGARRCIGLQVAAPCNNAHLESSALLPADGGDMCSLIPCLSYTFSHRHRLCMQSLS